MNAKIIQKLCSSIFSSVHFVDRIFIWMENRARWIGNNLEFSEPKTVKKLFIILLFFFGLFFTLIVLQAFTILYIANLWIVCGVGQFLSLKCELASCLKAHPWTYPTKKPKACHSTKCPPRRISVFPLAGETRGPATTCTCLFLMLRIYNHHRSFD